MKHSEDLIKLLDSDRIPFYANELIDFLTDRFKAIRDGELLAVLLLSKMHNEGHTRLDLHEVQGKIIGEEKVSVYKAPSLKEWLNDLNKGGITGKPEEFKPLIVEDKRWVYFHKYWFYENYIAEWMHKWAKKVDARPKSAQHYVLDKLNAEQQKAIQIGLQRQLLIITGGPGTGKTHIVSHLLKSLTESEKSIHTALIAPTGKAASRLNESIDSAEMDLETPPAVTIHALLGKRRGGGYRFHSDNKLPYDLLVVDEASMIDLSLMYHLLQAVPEKCKVVFLGDKDQLASVEAGSILGDLFQAAETNSSSTSLSTCMVQLTRNYRFGRKSGVGKLADACKNQDYDTLLQVLTSKKYADARLIEESFPVLLDEIYKTHVKPNFEKLTHTGNASEALSLFNSFKILLPLRSGLQGLEWVNNHFERRIKKDFTIPAMQEWFHGRPVTVTKNNYALKLRNGESGICWGNGNSAKVIFEAETDEGNAKEISPGQLSHYETGYTMSIHKSQGSEYSNVVILLPDADFPILTRELLYTAVTRARQSVLVYGRQAVLNACVDRKIERSSGLKQKLQNLIDNHLQIESHSD